MKDEDKTKEQLIEEMESLRKEVARLEQEKPECKRAEEELKRYKFTVESAHDAIFFKDPDSRYVVANAKTLEAFGLSHEEVIGKNDYELMTNRAEAKKNIEDDQFVFKTGKPKHITKHMTAADGKEYWFHAIKVPQFDEKGNIIGLIGIARDITERKRAEEELLRLSNAVKISTDSIVISDLEAKIIDVNEATLKMHGTDDKGDLIGKNSFDLIAPEDREKAFAGMEEVRERGYAQSREYHIITKDGSKIPVEMSSAIMKDVDGKAVGFVGVSRDITERKRAEEERRELEQKAQLASRLATVGEMASGIAHEINNPLTGVIGFAQLLMQKDLPEDIKEYAKIINDGGQRVANIVKRLLTFARQQKPERDYVDINQIIETTLQLRAYEMETSNIKVTSQLDTDLPGTVADANQLQQVFLNIIINAETEMKLAHGKSKLSIKTEALDNTIRISFKDNGPGIAKENVDKIFNPFFTTREVGEGAGLGLSICHRIIAAHGGRIYAKSKLGKGATFIVELPIITEDKQLAESATDEPQRVTGAKILVVDDEPSTLQLLSQILTGEGHKVQTTDNASDTLERIKSERYNLILLDIKLPGMSGMELYKSMQKIAQSLARRVVFITGDVMGADTRDFLSQTKAPYITKPFDIEQLKKDINRVLTQHA